MLFQYDFTGCGNLPDLLNAMDSDYKVQVTPKLTLSTRLISAWALTCLVVSFSSICILAFGFIPSASPSSRPNEGLRNGPKTSQDQGSSTAFQWEDIQEILCPAKAPNVSHAATLFSLARKEFGIPEDEFLNYRPKQGRPKRKKVELTYRFFHGEFQPATIFLPRNAKNGIFDGNEEKRALIYVNIWKAADTAIQQWMEATFKNSIHGSITLMTLEDFFNNKRTVDESLSLNPCIVTAVRDPISHFLSGYNEIEVRREWLLEDSKKYQLAQYWSMPLKTEIQREARMEQFVRDLLLEDSTGMQHYIYKHIFSMTRVLHELAEHTHQEMGLTNFTSSLSSLNETFPALLRDSCPSVIPSDVDLRAHNMNYYGQHRSSTDPDGFYEAAKLVWAKGGKIARALCALHAMDYACWSSHEEDNKEKENSSMTIPQVCKDLFLSEGFYAGLLEYG